MPTSTEKSECAEPITNVAANTYYPISNLRLIVSVFQLGATGLDLLIGRQGTQ
jgi:hypothetical protein